MVGRDFDCLDSAHLCILIVAAPSIVSDLRLLGSFKFFHLNDASSDCFKLPFLLFYIFIIFDRSDELKDQRGLEQIFNSAFNFNSCLGLN